MDHQILIVTNAHELLVTLPCWLPALFFALLPSQRLYMWTRRRSKARRAELEGLCPYCLYDLRATPDSAGPRLAVCPECGRSGSVSVPLR